MKNATRFPWEHEGDVVVFETPEQTRVERRIAPFGSRIVAALIDNVILSLIFFILGVGGALAFLASGIGVGREQRFYVVALVLALQFLINIFYFVWGELRGEGQTWGKRRLEIRTVMATGQGITFGASVVRNIARIVDNFPLLWLVPALTRGKRRLGDVLAGTLVVMDESAKSRKEPPAVLPPLAASYRELTDRRFYFSAELAAKLFPDDLNLLEHLESRLASAGPSQRRKVLEEVARKYIERLGLQVEEPQILEDPRRFLREMALFLKDRFEGQAY